MKPLDHHHALANAVPLPRARANAERDRHLREAARLHCACEVTDRAIARAVFTAYRRYRAGPWDRDCLAETMPERLRGRIDGCIWHALKAKDRALKLTTVRRALGHI